MRKHRKFQYIFIIIISFIFAFLSTLIANNKLKSFVDTDMYIATSRDLLNIVFMTDEFSLYPYLDRSDMTILLLIFTFYILGIIIVNYDFLSKSGEYYVFVYSRSGSKHKAIKYMKSNGFIKTIFYSVSYSIICYIASTWFIRKYYNLDEFFNLKLFIDVIIHLVVMIVTLLLLQKIVLFTYIKINSSFAFVSGLVASSFLLLLDIQLKNINIILFSPQKHFVDSIIILSIMNIFMFFIEEKFLYKQLPFDGGKNN